MNNIEIGIIGGTGGIGGWFADFFRKEGFTIHASGRRTGMAVPEMAGRCAVVIVGVPITTTCEVIRKVGPFMKEDSLLMDLTSLKTDSVRAMLESSPSEVIGLHPLFGPDVPSLAGQNIVVCPARGVRWSSWIGDLLSRQGAQLVETSPERHDEIMAAVQALTHLNTVAMGLVLKEAGLSTAEMEKFSTPVFRAKRALIERVFMKNPKLYAGIITQNPRTPDIVALYEKALARLKGSVLERDAEALEIMLKDRS